MGIWEIVIGAFVLLMSVIMIIVIILQEGHDAGLGTITGGADSFMQRGKAKTADAMFARITKYCAVIFFILIVLLNALSFFGWTGKSDDTKNNAVSQTSDVVSSAEGESSTESTESGDESKTSSEASESKSESSAAESAAESSVESGAAESTTESSVESSTVESTTESSVESSTVESTTESSVESSTAESFQKQKT